MHIQPLHKEKQSNPERNPGNVPILTLREDVEGLIYAIRYTDVSIDFESVTNDMINIFIEQIDIKLRNVESEESEYWRGYLEALRELKQDLEK